MDARRLADLAPASLLKVCLEQQLMSRELRRKLFYKEVMREHCVCVCEKSFEATATDCKLMLHMSTTHHKKKFILASILLMLQERRLTNERE